MSNYIKAIHKYISNTSGPVSLPNKSRTSFLNFQKNYFFSGKQSLQMGPNSILPSWYSIDTISEIGFEFLQLTQRSDAGL